MKSVGLSFEEISIDHQDSIVRTITDKDVDVFGHLSGDLNPLHMEETFVSQTPFKRRVVHGMFIAAILSALHTKMTGPGYVYVGQDLKFKAPVYIGDTVKASLRVVGKKEEKGILVLESIVTNQHQQVVLHGKSALKDMRKIL